jgi:hypothetical protein
MCTEAIPVVYTLNPGQVAVEYFTLDPETSEFVLKLRLIIHEEDTVNLRNDGSIWDSIRIFFRDGRVESMSGFSSETVIPSESFQQECVLL